MCCWWRCGRGWTALTVLWALVYVTGGAVQIVTGIFLLIALPQYALCSNVWAGTWNVVAGISGGMVACFGAPSPRRQRRLLLVAISVLAVNTVNAVLTEWTFYMAGDSLLLPKSEEDDLENDGEAVMLTSGDRDRHVRSLVANARLTAGIVAAIILVASFLDSQLSFCSVESTGLGRRTKGAPRGSHEQVSDIEYIIPRPKTNFEPKPTNSTYNAYAQSWVFETETSNSNSNHAASPYLKSYPDVETVVVNGKDLSSPDTGSHIMPKEETIIIANPIVHIEEASDESNSNSDRKLCYMKSFSRTPSPVILSAASSQASLNNPPIYECLEKLTEPAVYRSRLNTALSVKEQDETPQYASTSPRKSELPSPRAAEPAQYASLLLELEQAFTNKRTSAAVAAEAVITPQSDTHTTSESSQRTDVKSSDAEFSRELEAALQLIQDLESPNTAEPLAAWRHSDSEKTLSAVGSLAELTSPLAECLPEMTHAKPYANRATSVATASADDRVQLLRTGSYEQGPEDDPVVQTVSCKGLTLSGHPPPAQL